MLCTLELFAKFWPVYFALCLLLTVSQASLTCSSPARFHQVFAFANSSTFLFYWEMWSFISSRKHNLLCKALLGEAGLALLRQLAQAVGVPAPVTTLRDPTHLSADEVMFLQTFPKRSIKRKLLSPIGCCPWPTLCSWPEGSQSRGHLPRKTRCLASKFLKLKSESWNWVFKIATVLHFPGKV